MREEPVVFLQVISPEHAQTLEENYFWREHHLRSERRCRVELSLVDKDVSQRQICAVPGERDCEVLLGHRELGQLACEIEGKSRVLRQFLLRVIIDGTE